MTTVYSADTVILIVLNLSKTIKPLPGSRQARIDTISTYVIQTTSALYTHNNNYYSQLRPFDVHFKSFLKTEQLFDCRWELLRNGQCLACVHPIQDAHG